MPNMYKFVTVKASAKKIVLWKFIWCHICTKLLLWRQMLRKSSLWNAFVHATYVQNLYFAGKCSGNRYLKMHLACQICTFTLLVKGKCKGNCHVKMHLTPHMYKIITVKAHAKKIFTVKCVLTPHMYKTMSLWRQMLWIPLL